MVIGLQIIFRQQVLRGNRTTSNISVCMVSRICSNNMAAKKFLTIGICAKRTANNISVNVLYKAL